MSIEQCRSPILISIRGKPTDPNPVNVEPGEYRTIDTSIQLKKTKPTLVPEQ